MIANATGAGLHGTVRFGVTRARRAGTFVTLPDAIADEIRARYAGAHRPFGSLPVRRSEHVEDGDAATVVLQLDV